MADPESGTIAVLAEKPSVARDVAHELGATGRGDGYLYGNGYVVTWAIGHLVALAQPHEINPEWRHWRRDLLPILPKHWPLVVYENTKDQFEVVGRILNSPRVSRVVCATDAGREGELIFRYIYEASECRKPFSRLWISSLTPAAIRKGFEALRPGADYDPLADAARGRSRADWLVGMNLSRAYSLAYDEELSVGRVQTPTLAMVVERIRRKAMTQVVQTRAMTVRGAPQADLSRQRIERSMNLSAIQSMAPVGDEQIRGDHSSHPMAPTSGDIVRQHRTGRSMQRHQASFTELGAADRQHRRLQIHILQFEVACFAEA
jgi:DNA topoisomerase IA